MEIDASINSSPDMSADEQIALVRRYFAAVDAENLPGILDTLTNTCRFAVETHNVTLNGVEDITTMFERLWGNHQAVKHHQFRFVTDPVGSRITAQFQVVNTEQDGSLTYKSNCNVFDISDGRFSQISVYMAGPNTLDRK